MPKRQGPTVNFIQTIGAYANPEPQSVGDLDAANASLNYRGGGVHIHSNKLKIMRLIVLYSLKVINVKRAIIFCYLFQAGHLLEGGRFYIYFIPVSQT
jgi:hypothetical protein